MEKELLVDDVKLSNCPCRSPQCAHCSLREAICGERLNDQLMAARIAEGGADDEDSDVLLHALSGATRSKLKLPCRRDSRSLSSSLASPSRDRLISKSWPPLPFKRASSVDSVVYADARADLEKSEKKLPGPSMVTITSSSIEVEQEIVGTQPLPNLEHPYSSAKKLSTTCSPPAGSANPRRICRFCNREFPSGRALGGHMRVHGGLDADSFPSTNQSMPGRQETDKSTHRSSSPLTNLKPENRFAEVNCLVNGGSKAVNSYNAGGSVLGRRINSEESMVRGASPDERKSALFSRGLMSEERIPVWRSAEQNSAPSQKNEQFVKQLKDQLVIKEASRRELNSAETQKSSAIYANVEFNEKSVKGNEEEEKEDDDDDDDLYSSKLMALGNANEAAPQGNMESLASECVVDEGNSPHKLRPNPRPSRRRLWPDREGTASDINTKLENSGRLSSSPPTLRVPPPANHMSSERARPCSECGKVFWSWKALFGHMRCHPEREWRGIQRPDTNTSEFDNRQVSRACKSKLSSLSLVAGNAELEMELESDAENHAQACKLTTQVMSSISASAKEEGLDTQEDAEIELTKGLDDIGEAEGLQKAEDCSIKGVAKRALKSRILEDSGDDDLAPSAWPTRKRSRRSRANGGGGVAQKVVSTTSAEPALTSETATSSEPRDTEKVSIKDLQEDLDMANCLVLLSSAGMRAQGSEKRYVPESTQEFELKKHGMVVNYGRSRHVHSIREGSGGEYDVDDGLYDEDDEEAENFAELSYKHANAGSNTAMRYECSTCKRCFKSHQALGGHRASHRKTKGCFALMNQHADNDTMQESKEDNIADVNDFISSELNQRLGHMLTVAPSLHHQQADEEKTPFMLSPSLPTASLGNKKKKFKGHACSICHRIFPSGQALGGHKRCHWTGEKIAESGSMASSSNNNRAFLQDQYEQGGDGNEGNRVHQAKRLSKEDGIDLNLPAPLDEEDEAGYVDNAGLSSTDAMDPDVENAVDEVEELDGEEDNEGQLVDYIGGKKRSLNGLSGKWIVADSRRHQPDTPWL